MWKTVRLGDLCEVITKGTTPTSIGFKFESEGINFVKVESLAADSTFITSKFAKINSECHESLKRSQLKDGDILFSIAGALGRTAIVTGDILPANTNQALAIVRLKPNVEVEKRFLLYVLNSESTTEQSDSNKGGVAQQNLSLTQLKNYKISLPPLAEQQRIVAKLDAAFAEIDRATEIEGEKLLNAENLRAAYLDERLKKLLHEKPSFCLSDVCEKVSVGHVGTTSKYYCDEGIPFIRTQNVSKTGFNDTELRYITPEFHESLKKSQLKAGDVLLSRVVIDEMRTAIVPRNYGEANCANVILIRPKEKLLPQYLSLLIKSRESQEYFMDVKKGAAQQVVNTGILKKWNIPLPSVNEQTKFVEEITNRFELVESLLISVTNKKHVLSKLKSAILSQELQPPQSEAA